MERVLRTADLKESAVVLHDGQTVTADEARFICRVFGVAEGATFNGAFADLSHADIEDGDVFTASVGSCGVTLWMDHGDDCRVHLPIMGLKAHAEPTGWVAIRAGK